MIVDDIKLRTGQNENGTWWARQKIDGCPFLGEGETESQALDDLMIASGNFKKDNNQASDAGLWG